MMLYPRTTEAGSGIRGPRSRIPLPVWPSRPFDLPPESAHGIATFLPAPFNARMSTVCSATIGGKSHRERCERQTYAEVE
jgi:hypothetical protein